MFNVKRDFKSSIRNMQNCSVKILSAISICICFALIQSTATAALPIIKGIGGEFTLTDQNYRTVKLSDYKDKVVLLFFGYTNCADICPTTMGYLSAAMNELSIAEQENLQVLFVSIDPEYDTPEHLRKYLDFFNEDFIGLIGTKAEIDQVVKLYNTRYNQVVDALVTTEHLKFQISKEGVEKSEDKSHLYTHSSSIFLIDELGRTRTAFSTGTPMKKVIESIRSLMHGTVPSTAKSEMEAVERDVMNALSYPAGISIKNGWVREVPPVTRNTAAYMEIENFGEEVVTLVSVRTVIAMNSEVHQSSEENGIVRMVRAGELEIQPHSSLILKPSSYHLMIMGLTADAPKAGETVSFDLEFSNGESVHVELDVKAPALSPSSVEAAHH